MLISHQARCIFVHMQKTGASTVEAVLRAYLPDAQRLGFKHDHGAWHRAGVPARDRYFRFTLCAIRKTGGCPGHAMMLRKGRRTWVERARGRGPRNRLWQYVNSKGRRFKDFVRHCTDVVEDCDGRKCCAWNQLDYFTGADGAPRVDFVGRFEHFERDLRGALDRLGLGKVAIPHVNAVAHAHYPDYYTPALAAVVARQARSRRFRLSLRNRAPLRQVTRPAAPPNAPAPAGCRGERRGVFRAASDHPGHRAMRCIGDRRGVLGPARF